VKKVYLTSGPRGSGKSTFVEKVASLRPGITVISRDAILIELFNSTSLSPYGGDHYYAMKILSERVSDFLSGNNGDELILDLWNGFPRERQAIIRMLKERGADRVVCWQFVLPVDLCVRWFFMKPDSEGYCEPGIRRDYDLYYKTASGIENDGFDGIHHIDPCQPEIPLAIFQ
jgi:adenylate kinase family enzyme